MPTYKTPDVYVEEISTLPRSVAEVATAIPAFIGYTQKDTYKNQSKHLVPTRIKSLVEYEELFGQGPAVDIAALSLDANNSVQNVEFNSNYFLYDSLRLFFKNGGGKCYIISVGLYGTPVAKADISAGLEVLKKEDEPTLILFPDAVILDAGLYDLQVEALAQCNKLGDRFAIMDLVEKNGWEDGIEKFRNAIGVNYLKYGAAYTPHVKASLPRAVTYRDLQDHIVSVSNQAEDAIQTTIGNLKSAIEDVDDIEATALNAATFDTLEAAYLGVLDNLKTAINADNLGAAQGELDNLFGFAYDALIALPDEWAKAASTLADYYDEAGAISATIKSNKQVARDTLNNVLYDALASLSGYNKTISAFTGSTDEIYVAKAAGVEADWTDAGAEDDPWNTANIAPNTALFPFQAPADDDERIANIKAVEKKVTSHFYEILAGIGSIVEKANNLERTLESNLKQQYPVYSNIAAQVGQTLMTLPPSGAVAGIYAATDENRGVWKAPANVSLSAVSGLTRQIDSEEQEDLNVDTTAGKSINAIRPFTGRGILVWGARTLAGNDNEWRYVPVRRFYNMAEESIKKATYWAVFEPNDANLWIRLKSMIENYLTLKWREGALAGSKPEQAYFVNVGLGITMTPQDILEGRLIVEIGMAVVRPAEFIILRFSHKMQEA